MSANKSFKPIPLRGTVQLRCQASAMNDQLDSLPSLNPRQAYLAMLEFLETEFALAGGQKTIHLGGLLAEMALEDDGSTSDPGAARTFADAIQKVISPSYRSQLKGRWAEA